MPDGLPGPRGPSWPVLKIFSAFRIAFDIKKLALAGAGIIVTWLGWWALCLLFYSPTPPEWKNYDGQYGSQTAAFHAFQRDLARWTFLHKLAGPPTIETTRLIREGPGDVAVSPEELNEFQAVVDGRRLVSVDVGKRQLLIDGVGVGTIVGPPKAPPAEGDVKAPADPALVAFEADLEAIKNAGPIPIIDIDVDEKEKTVTVAKRVNAPVNLQDKLPTVTKIVLKVDPGFEAIADYRKNAKPLAALSGPSHARFVAHLLDPRFKPSGKFRVCPWNENRGENPYLLTTKIVAGENAFGNRSFAGWLLHEQLPILAEPLVKFVAPIYYLFKSEASGFRNTTFLLLVIFWNLGVWGYFGGAICRLSAVQFARNEKIPLGEALAFVNQRARQFVLAPVFPLIALAILAGLLALFGLVAGWTHLFGDIVVAGVFWPLVVLLGLVMAVVLVGLFGWPLMYPTIAVEGSDSFDALSRSYSYLYQSPWKYLGYSASAFAYGAALVFFVGFMGSLTVYLGKWGFSQAPGLVSEEAAKDRTPAYFFRHAPTSFGWRDLFLHDSPWAVKVSDVKPSAAAPLVNVGAAPTRYELKEDYVREISWNNAVGGWMVGFWLGIVFILVVGFGYSYFWTAATIIYFLMRSSVDNTDHDEIYLEDDEMPPPPPPKAPPPPPAKPGVVSLSVVDPPKPG